MSSRAFLLRAAPRQILRCAAPAPAAAAAWRCSLQAHQGGIRHERLIPLLLPTLCTVTQHSVRGCATHSPSSNPPAPPISASSSAPQTSESGRMLDEVAELSEEDKELIRRSLSDPSSAKSGRMGGAGIGPKEGDMVAAFTCGVCNTRSVKRFTKHSYTKGIVIVECPGCLNKHLIADNLGWFDDVQTNIEDILRAKGVDFVRVGGNVHVENFTFSPNDAAEAIEGVHADSGEAVPPKDAK